MQNSNRWQEIVFVRDIVPKSLYPGIVEAHTFALVRNV